MTLRTRPLRAAVLTLALAFSPALVSAQPVPPGDTSDRAMAFRPGLGTNHERVPGGRLLVGAYGAILLVLGGYVAYVARRAAVVDAEVRRLEDDMARRRPATEDEA